MSYGVALCPNCGHDLSSGDGCRFVEETGYCFACAPSCGVCGNNPVLCICQPCQFCGQLTGWVCAECKLPVCRECAAISEGGQGDVFCPQCTEGNDHEAE